MKNNHVCQNFKYNTCVNFRQNFLRLCRRQRSTEVVAPQTLISQTPDGTSTYCLRENHQRGKELAKGLKKRRGTNQKPKENLSHVRIWGQRNGGKQTNGPTAKKGIFYDLDLAIHVFLLRFKTPMYSDCS